MTKGKATQIRAVRFIGERSMKCVIRLLVVRGLEVNNESELAQVIYCQYIPKRSVPIGTSGAGSSAPSQTRAVGGTGQHTLQEKSQRFVAPAGSTHDSNGVCLRLHDAFLSQ